LSGAINISGLVTFEVLVDGQPVTSLYPVTSIDVTLECNRIPTAVLTVVDGSAAEGDFKASNDEVFMPGKEIEIKAGYNNLNETIFKGEVIKQNIKISPENSFLIITCKDKAYKLTLGRKNQIFYELSDSDAIEKIIKDKGLQADVESTNFTHNELVQYQATDWDFMLSRAQVVGAIVNVSQGEIEVKKPKPDQDAVLTALFGDNILSFDAEIDARNQFSNYTANSWDYASQEILSTEATNYGEVKTGNIESSVLSEANGGNAEVLNHSGLLKSEALKSWADAKSMMQQLSILRGTLQLQGNDKLQPGKVLNLEGVGERFSGNVFMGGVHHLITEGNWLSTVQLGLEPKWFAEQHDISAMPASAMLPAVSGLQIGVVTALEGDPDGEQRIKVKIPIVNAEEEGVWARVLTPYAGDNYGVQFIPEIGNEVLLGFLNDDPNQAIVLGSLFSSANTMPIELSDDNFEKIIQGNSEIKLLFNDDKKSISIETPNGNIINLNDDEGKIELTDENGNSILMNSDGITIESAKDLILKASGDVKIEGTNIEATAAAEFKAEGSASSEVSSGGTMTVKGALVQIN
jgi:Rhs element Vgr protein